jgi:hypothetical protein
MLGVEAVAERMTDNVVGHHPTMPGGGKAAQAVDSTCRIKDSFHGSIMTIVPSLCNTMAAAGSAERNAPVASDRNPAMYSPICAKCRAN